MPSERDPKHADHVRIMLESIEIDVHGRLVVNDPVLASQIDRAKKSGADSVYLAANEGNYCVLPSGCPVTGQNVGCGCPTLDLPDNE